VLGPGTLNLNAGLAKYFNITERVRIKIECSFTNVLNHTNLADPVLAIDNGSVGQITAAQGSDFGGYRTGQVGARVKGRQLANAPDLESRTACHSVASRDNHEE